MKKDLTLTNPSYNVRHEHGRDTSEYDSTNENDIAEMMEICCDHLKVEDHAHRFCSVA